MTPTTPINIEELDKSILQALANFKEGHEDFQQATQEIQALIETATAEAVERARRSERA